MVKKLNMPSYAWVIGAKSYPPWRKGLIESETTTEAKSESHSLAEPHKKISRSSVQFDDYRLLLYKLVWIDSGYTRL